MVVSEARMKLDPGLLSRLPKVLLHEHLDGVLRPQTVVELAASDVWENAPAGRRTAVGLDGNHVDAVKRTATLATI